MSSARESEWQRRKRRERMRAEYMAIADQCQLCFVERGKLGKCKSVPARPWDEDHDHKTGAHRGFICARSNRALQAWMTPEWLELAAEYLRVDADGVIRGA